MDEALEWIDESIYLGKKVLVHCRHGIGRTGTIVSAYLLRKGLSARLVRKKLKLSAPGRKLLPVSSFKKIRPQPVPAYHPRTKP
jgi:protein-tyrosine phosphatase